MSQTIRHTNSAGTMPHECSAKLAVFPAGEETALRDRANQLAQRLGLPLTSAGAAEYDLLLTVTPSRLELRDNTPGGPGPVYVDFVGGSLGHHRRAGRLEQQRLLFKAIGRSTHTATTVVDATAGLGRDAFLLACKGCHVTAVERSAVLVALLQDGLDRAARVAPLDAIVRDRFRLVHADADTFLKPNGTHPTPDVIYLDPMFPPKKKSALVKKEMRILRRLVGDDEDAYATFAAAAACAPRRIVVKRFRYAPPLAANPTRKFKGKTTRYDVYEF